MKDRPGAAGGLLSACLLWLTANPMCALGGVLATVCIAIAIAYAVRPGPQGILPKVPLVTPAPPAGVLCTTYGFYINVVNDSYGVCAPMQCAPGFQPPVGVFNSTTASQDCVPCEPTMYNSNVSHNTPCQTCAPGTFAMHSGQSSCTNCMSRYALLFASLSFHLCYHVDHKK
jgi:hypothetical protein